MLKAAERPLVLAGGGGWTDAGRHALQKFAETNGLPVAVAFRNQDLIDSASASYIGDAGVGMLPYLKGMLREADVILALNVRFGETLTIAQGRELRRPSTLTAEVHGSAERLSRVEVGGEVVVVGRGELRVP